MFEKVLEQIIAEFWNLKPQYIFRSFFEPYFKSKKCTAIIGPRRAGKSYLLYQIRDYLIKTKSYNLTDFLYVNFENLGLKGFTYKNFDEILKTYNSIYPEKKPIIMFDEIQNIDLWYKYVRNLADLGYLVYITGSNSKMISKEIALNLGARYIVLKVYPFSFKEFLELKGIQFEKQNIILNHNKIVFAFKEYLAYGGFPEITNQSPEIKKQILRNYFDLALGDIIKRWSVSDNNALEIFVKKLKENITTETTIKNYCRFFKSIDYKISQREIYRFVKYLQDSFFLFGLESQKKSIRSRTYLKKYYFIDNGYISLFEFEKDDGLKLENIVFCSLLKMGKEINYYKDKKECDFIVRKDKGLQAIQVTYELNENNREREIQGLIEALDYYDLKKGYIITGKQEEEFEKGGKKIKVIPAWKWMLSG